MDIVTSITQLRKPTKQVGSGDDISDIVANLFAELGMYRNAGGLSANQLGYNKRVFVMIMKPCPPICIVNPLITKQRGSQIGEEFCLSLPGHPVTVKRPQQIVVKGENQYHKYVKYKLSGLQARIACHEIDHLNGKLITDYKLEQASKEEVTE